MTCEKNICVKNHDKWHSHEVRIPTWCFCGAIFFQCVVNRFLRNPGVRVKHFFNNLNYEHEHATGWNAAAHCFLPMLTQSVRQFSSYDLGEKDFRMCESNKSEHVCWGAACENRNRPLIHRKSSDDVPVVAKCQKFHQSNSAGAASFLFTYIA